MREPDKGFFVSVGRLQAGVYGVDRCGDHETSKSRLIDLARSDGTASSRRARKRACDSVEHHPSIDGKPVLIIQTNADDAEDYKIVSPRSILLHASTGAISSRTGPAQ